MTTNSLSFPPLSTLRGKLLAAVALFVAALAVLMVSAALPPLDSPVAYGLLLFAGLFVLVFVILFAIGYAARQGEGWRRLSIGGAVLGAALGLVLGPSEGALNGVGAIQMLEAFLGAATVAGLLACGLWIREGFRTH